MKNRLIVITVFSFLILFSISIMILPSFMTKGVSRVKVYKNVNMPLILNSENDIELIFFGYAGCVNICTPRLKDIASWYKKSPYKNRMQVKFMDISKPKDRSLPDAFAKVFDDDFVGVYLSETLIREYTKMFSVYFAKSFIDENKFDHTTNLYLLKRSKEGKVLRFIYSAYPFDFKQISLDIKEISEE